MNRKNGTEASVGLLHDREELQGHQVQRDRPERDIADAERDGDQREGDRESR